MSHLHKLRFAFLIVLAAGTMQAGIVTYNFSGTIIGFHGPAEPLFAGLGVGSTVSGGFRYDDTTQSLNNDPFIADYTFQNLFLQAGQNGYISAGPILEIDANNVYNWELGGRAADPIDVLDLVLQNSFGPYLHADVLLRPPPDPMAVDIHYGSLYINHGGEANITGLIFNLDNVTACSATPGGRLPGCNQPPVSAPEPATFGLVALALSLLACCRRAFACFG